MILSYVSVIIFAQFYETISLELTTRRGLDHHQILRRLAASVSDLEEFFLHLSHKNSIEIDFYGPDLLKLMLSDIQLLPFFDGYSTWRTRALTNLSETVQKELNILQFPENCSIAKKVVCDLKNQNCGFGCMVHHLVVCLSVAYGTKRTLVINTLNGNFVQWNKLFKPISSCELKVFKDIQTCGDVTKEVDDIYLPDYGVFWYCPKSEFVPRAVPFDILNRLKRLHGNPVAWWVGQLSKFIMRPIQPIDIKKEGFVVVGVHIRRSDKIKEAEFHELNEYLSYVDNFFDIQKLSWGIKKRIYIASDVSRLKVSALTKYQVVSSPSNLSMNRYSEAALRNVVKDIYWLSKCDYLVCTFSSNVCRLAYELMQTSLIDASANVKSLDDLYYYYRGTSFYAKAIFNHTPVLDTEIELVVEDVIHLIGNLWNGWTKGINLRTNLTGIFPSFKVEEIFHSFKTRSMKQVYTHNLH